MLTIRQHRALNKWRKQFILFLKEESCRNRWVENGSVIQVYMRKGSRRLINGETRYTLDIANIFIDQPGKGLGMKVFKLIHKMNPFEVTFVESIINKRLYKRLRKEGWKDVKNANPPCVFLRK